MNRSNILEDLNAHRHLKGKVFRRKMLDPTKVKGLGYLSLAGFSYAYFPYIALHFGANLTTLGISAASLKGMFSFQEKNVINSIEFVKDGEHVGKVKFNISTSPFTSKNVIADVGNVQGVYSLGNDDMGENDLETNVISLKNYLDCSTGETIDESFVTLPADGWKDLNLLDWIISIKWGEGHECKDSSEAEFNDLMIEIYKQKA